MFESCCDDQTGAILVAVLGSVFFILLGTDWIGKEQIGNRPFSKATLRLSLIGWVFFSSMLSIQGWYERTPYNLSGAALAVFAVCVLYFLASSSFRRLAWATPLSWLVGIQVFRAVSIVFILERGVGGELLQISGRFGGVAIGAAAALAAWLARRDFPAGEKAVLLWNILGAIEILAALAGAYARPEAASPPLTRFPYSLIVTFLYPLAMFLHLVVFLVLSRRHREAEVKAGSGA